MGRVLTRDKNFYKTLLALALPISFQNLVTFMISFADNLMIGSLGDYAVSGVYIGNQPQTLLQMLTGGISVAMLVLSAQYWGNNDTRRIKIISGICMRVILVICVVLSIVCLVFTEPILRIFNSDIYVLKEGVVYLRYIAASYVFFGISQLLISAMRSVEVAKIGLYVSLFSLIVNISLNYVLIFGKLGFPALGVEGAAIATLISRFIEAAVIAVYVFRIDKKLQLRIKELLFCNEQNKEDQRLLIKDLFKYGLPVLSGEFVWAVNNLANTAIIGWYSAEIMTAVSMTGVLNTLVYVWITGLSSAVGIITGKTVGAGEKEKMKEYAKTVQIMFLLVGVVTSLAVYLLKSPLLSMYNASAEAKDYGLQFMSVLSVTIIGTCYQAACLGGLVKAGGDTSFVFKNDTIFVFLVVLPSAIITSKLGLPVWIVFACLKSDQILKCIVAVVKINSFNWMKRLVR